MTNAALIARCRKIVALANESDRMHALARVTPEGQDIARAASSLDDDICSECCALKQDIRFPSRADGGSWVA